MTSNGMKKFLFLIAVFVCSSSAIPAHAQLLNNKLGTCTYTVAGITNTVTDTSYNDCKALDATAVWTENPPSGSSSGAGSTPEGQGQGRIYNLLAPLPCAEDVPGCDPITKTLKTFDPTTQPGESNKQLSRYLNIMIRIFIGICAVLAVIMIVIGGLEYMTSELIGEKADGKRRIVNALLGLVLALGAWTILHEINPSLLVADLASLEGVEVEVTLEDQIKSYTGQGTCTPVANSSNPCSPENLAKAGFAGALATQASSICNGESKGVVDLASGVDKCSDGKTSFSYGLFQVNILAHADEIPGGVCSNIFQKNGSGTQGTCLEKYKDNRTCIRYDCSVKDQAKLSSCISYITNPANNIKYAKDLQARRDWGQWGAYNSCQNTFPPK